MDKFEITERVGKIICRQLGVSSDQVKPGASIKEDLHADSLAVVDLVLDLEETFRLAIPDEDSEEIRTVQDAIDYVSSHAAKVHEA